MLRGARREKRREDPDEKQLSGDGLRESDESWASVKRRYEP
jgi:hypothetical protein